MLLTLNTLYVTGLMISFFVGLTIYLGETGEAYIDIVKTPLAPGNKDLIKIAKRLMLFSPLWVLLVVWYIIRKVRKRK